MTTWTVGQVADVFGVTVRTLHHYDEIGLLVPSERSAAGYRLYTDEDLRRLQQIVVYRRLELPLDEIASLLDGDEDPDVHLRRQREVVMQRFDELTELVVAIDRALEREMDERPATTAELKELFGDGFSDDYQQEAQERWGETDAWKQSAARTSRYTPADWAEVKAEMEAVNAAFVAALESGEPATGEAAMDAAEAHRLHIERRFYDLSHDVHRGLADMYVADPRFTKTYEDLAPGLAAYVRDAIHANADRHA
ncbi:MerR family transcriptional regulator [Humibacillus xanthopallidus]|uniref:DNA-binding transcriptional MerR regulator n=1 Tax=Humibacillus xanthopallidus TaxID=412689 RepID=A0A543I1K9_9MICO|nr:MerR family transcriptional regulator [Humibacillus xanthopallidus]TQM64461.1 DNA-binding transcriptional MerR regulator [Humibacillus xanthopallidus]